MKNTTLLLTACAAMLAYTPRQADACGGTFCDTGPQAMPVDQTGENILFVMGGDYTEAHIQIQYDPSSTAPEFSWLVPLTSVPEFGVGSELLFDAVMNASVPQYGFSTTFTGQGCSDDDSGPPGISAGADPTAGDGTDGGIKLDLGGGGPDILLEEVVGAFEITVLSGDNLQEVKDWLDENGYAQDPNADPILEAYLEEGYLFAAFKLVNDAETAEIHPITLRFDNDEACIPLRLTRIAAVDDMDIRSFFLSDDRVVPSTYKHVLVNPLKLDWANQAANYKAVITQAVDADEANGRAFVTEYAGPSDIVPTAQLFGGSWDAEPFTTIDPSGVTDELRAQGLMTCFPGGGPGTSTGSSTGGDGGALCQYEHPLLRGLLQRYLPVPEGVSEVDFYGCLSCYADQIDTEAWDNQQFADALAERIILPGQHATEVLAAFPTLTRMYTTMSPGEMTEDPFFYQNPDLQDVDLRAQFATRGAGCDSSIIWTLPDGREVYSPDGSWPDFDDAMPWEEEVAEMMPAGAPMVLVDRTELIATQLAEYNCRHSFPTPAACGNDPGDDSSSATDGTSQDDPRLDDQGGCSCRTDGSGSTRGGLLGLLALLGLRRRHARVRTRH
jgi:MYXO-CTERM domain-containing protein